ncbi:MAG TPA: hypothetical protein VF138_06410 [Caulobacteraceae bacterium]
MANTYPEDGSQAPGMNPDLDTQSDTGLSGIKEQVGQAADRVRGEAASFADTARQRAYGAVEQRQQQATTTMREFADAVRSAGDQLRSRDQTMAAQLVQRAAEGLEGVTRSVEGKSPQEMLHAFRDFGRRNPAAFIGGSVLLGIAIGRFIRSSRPEDDYDASGFNAQWEGESMVRGDQGASGADGLDANAGSFDAESADMTLATGGEGAGAVTRDSGLHSDLQAELDSDDTTTRGT